MQAELVFPVMNVATLPVWALWILTPKSRAARYLASALWPWMVLCAAYGVLIALSAVLDAPRGASFWTLGGVMAIFDAPWATMAGWMHYLVFDLFVGRWIVSDAPDAGYRLAPFLVLTLLYGPLGLLAYAVARSWLREAALASS